MTDEIVRVVIGGDTVPTETNVRAFAEGDVELLMDDSLHKRLRSADLAIVNLETPLADVPNPVPKCGPNLIAPTAAAKGLASIGIDVCALANNHIMDQGAAGLRSTIAVLDSLGIEHFGAAGNLQEAAVPFTFEVGGVRIGVYACAEHEFSIAGETEPGANPFDPLVSLDHVADLKECCDFVAVLYHGGKEHYRYPSPWLRKACRRFAEKGADFIVCQHSHCVGCMEEWQGSTIVYGQGNLLFDHSESEFWQTGLLLEVEVRKDGHEVRYLPIRKDGSAARLAEGEDAEDIIEGFLKRSLEIMEPEFVEGEYRKFAESYMTDYLRAFIPCSGSLVFRAANKISKGAFLRMLARGCNRLAARNYIECEAHRELFLEGLRSV